MSLRKAVSVKSWRRNSDQGVLTREGRWGRKVFIASLSNSWGPLPSGSTEREEHLRLLFSSSVVSSSLPPNGLQHARLPCLSPSPEAYSNSCSLSQWCHPIISSSVLPFSCLLSFPAPGSFPMSQFFTSGGQSTGTSASASVLPMNIQGWFPLGLTGLISLQSKGLSRVLSNTTVQKQAVLWHSAFLMVQLSHPYIVVSSVSHSVVSSSLWPHGL